MYSNGVMMLIIWLGMGGLVWWVGGFAAWFLFFALGVTGLTQLGLAMAPFGDVTVTRQTGHQFTAGDEIEVSVTINRAAKRPLLWLVIVDEWHHKLIFPGFQKRMNYSYRLRSIERGYHRSKRVNARTGDLFGWWIREKSIASSMEVLVYPKPVAFSSLPRVKSAQIHEFLRKEIHSSDLEPNGQIRAYQPGDRLSQIHWAQSASKLSWVTKSMDEGDSMKRCLFLMEDSSKAWKEEAAFEQAVSVTAGMVGYVLNQHPHLNDLDMQLVRERRLLSHAKAPEVSQNVLFRKLAEASMDLIGEVVQDQGLPSLDSPPQEQTVIYVAPSLNPKLIDQLRGSGITLKHCLFIQLGQGQVPSLNERAGLQRWLSHGGDWVYLPQILTGQSSAKVRGWKHAISEPAISNS